MAEASQDLTSYITADKWDVNAYFQPGLMDRYKINNKYYGVSQLSTFGSVLLYNKDLLDKAGLKPPPVDWNDASWTMDKALEYATKLTKDPGSPNGTFGMSLDLWAKMTSLPFLWGGDSWTKEHYTDFIAPKTNFNSEPVLQAHTFLQDLIYKHKVMPDPATAKSLGQLGNPFQTGKIAMALDGGWLYWTSSAIKDFKFGFAALPTAKSNKNINFNDFWIMGRWAKNKDSAWQVMRLLSSEEATTKYAEMTFTPPTPRKSLDAFTKALAKASGQSSRTSTRSSPGQSTRSAPRSRRTICSCSIPSWTARTARSWTPSPTTRRRRRTGYRVSGRSWTRPRRPSTTSSRTAVRRTSPLPDRSWDAGHTKVGPASRRSFATLPKEVPGSCLCTHGS